VIGLTVTVRAIFLSVFCGSVKAFGFTNRGRVEVVHLIADAREEDYAPFRGRNHCGAKRSANNKIKLPILSEIRNDIR
jgi:hypothetical protein